MPEIRPQPGAQEAFLSSPADVVFYGGAAGGGKSFGLLLEPTRYINTVDRFGAVIFRRETPQITNEGGLWDESLALYRRLGGRPRSSPQYLDWTFPKYKNRIKFAHMANEDDRFNWDSSQIPLIEFDQLEQFTRQQFFYMFSRNRSTCGIRPYIRGGYNPVPDDDEVGGWIHEWVGWYLDERGEYPDPNKAGIIRWFIVESGELRWFDTEQAALEYVPSSRHDDEENRPKTFTYIPASVYDNPALLAADPGYLANLRALLPVEQERLLYANHRIRPAAGNVINRDWLNVVDRIPPTVASVRFWDFAATEKKRRAGAATSSVKMVKDIYGRYGIIDVTEDWIGAAQVNDHAVAVARQDGPLVWQRWEEEGGSSGKINTAALASKMAGLNCGGVRPTGDKLDRLRPFASQCLAGNVWILRSEFTDRLLAHLHNTPMGRWDVRDACSGSFAELVEFRMPDVVGFASAKVQKRR